MGRARTTLIAAVALLAALVAGCAARGDPETQECGLVSGGLEACRSDRDVADTYYCRDLLRRCGR